ncbi:mediator of RNA polymerase II transcription subunit 14 [Paracoccidioides lutzii Pb01]|uniref:Mediator of RNA polymerase II transcription subunit 14 n=1 Tax=Paracoccidioides lutzii (strain ATCC MYA-826 / Pb01) TaxID=502779 RepID=C1GR40_PARBA|nr:mediator of RNA polymerase II transcription subunit 14 [Paracoccidioides lutzii Pb01]EEH38064.2 mediator of RNA polymerase II transcription subunit 14 [Paracoccidioides lutzii Pb01]
MPGIIMDAANASGPGRETTRHDVLQGAVSNTSLPSQNNGNYSNGPAHTKDATKPTNPSLDDSLPPELVHISQGFFPLGQLINRAAQQCWNDLTDLIAELADPQTTALNSSSHAASAATANGKYPSSQSADHAQKKLRILEFAQSKRADFIKILVLSQWSRRAADVSKLIDIQAFIRMRYDCYNGAILSIGEMKRDLIRAQTANPDLAVALEVLSTGKVAAMNECSFIPPKPLTPKMMLKTLRKINKAIRTRLVLHDQIPAAFTNYVVHDGRVTFKVPTEFEVDLSIAQEDRSSQFFFVDIRFLFSPSPPKPTGRLLDELDNRVNAMLMHSGLTGCFNLLHNLVLSNKITILFHQAIELARGPWLDTLRVEVLHRTLVVQYWINRPRPKSWIEIGIKSGRRKIQIQDCSTPASPLLGLRWMRDGKEVQSKYIKFDLELLSTEAILRSVIALHVSYLLQSTYVGLSQGRLYASGALSVSLQTSMTEPGDCFLDVQLTKGRDLRVMIEPVSGTIIFRSTPLLLNRHDMDRSSEKPVVDDILFRISRLRSAAAVDEVESLSSAFGWQTVNSRDIRGEDLRRIFPANTLRSILFFRKSWERNWGVAYTCSMDGDHWWVVELRTPSSQKGPLSPQSARMVTGRYGGSPHRLNYGSFGQLDHALSGVLAIHANARCLSDLHGIHHFPSLPSLVLGPHLHVPNIFIRFRTVSLPPALQISPPIANNGKPPIKDTIRLSFRGIDPSSQCAVMIAYGYFSREIKGISLLAVRLDRSVAFQPNGRAFAMRFLTPVGQPVIIQLLARLQQLERIISTLEILKRKSLKPLSLTLTRVRFAYAAEGNARASINFNYHEQAVLSGIDSITRLSKQAPLMILRTTMDFHPQSPHRRIKESLTATLNGTLRPRTFTCIDTVLQLLIVTLPVLKALDHISIDPHADLPGNSRLQIISRSSKIFHLRYPSVRYRFCIYAALRRDRVVWVLRDFTSPAEKDTREPLEEKLRETIYNARRDGWQGMGNGALADSESVGALLSTLHGVMTDYLSSVTGIPVRGGGASGGGTLPDGEKPVHNNFAGKDTDNKSKTQSGQAGMTGLQGHPGSMGWTKGLAAARQTTDNSDIGMAGHAPSDPGAMKQKLMSAQNKDNRNIAARPAVNGNSKGISNGNGMAFITID